MRILQIGMGNNPGGVEAFVMNYYKELYKKDVQFHFLCMYPPIACKEEIDCRGGKIFYVPNVKKDYFGYVKSVKRILQQGKYDAVHVNMLSAANILPLRLAAVYGNTKVIAHSHNSSAPGFLRNLMDKMNRPKIEKYADMKLACGEQAGRWLFGDEAYDRGEVTLVRNAIDVERFLFSGKKRRQIRKELGFGDDFVIGHVGRFEPQKNHEGLIRIFYEITKQIPNPRLCLIGDGVLKPQIEKMAEELRIREKIYFAGVRNNVPDFLSAMDVFLFPSLFEGLPFTLVEAQANGLPCVISDTITDEVVVSKEWVKKTALDADRSLWAEAVMEFENKPRRSPSEVMEEMEQAHFDIKQEADRLKLLYQA